MTAPVVWNPYWYMPAGRPAPGPDPELTWQTHFCGAGGDLAGAQQAGIDGVMAVNHWPLAVQSHAANHRRCDHDITDVLNVHPSRYPTTWGAWLSPECFVAGTLVLTARGLVPIEDVKVGDEVLTHQGRWRPVTQVMRRRADTVVVEGHGHPGLEATADHPVWSRAASRRRAGRKLQYRRHLAEPEWTPAAGLAGRFWATPTCADELPVPAVGGRGVEFTEDFWWVVGRWLGDGCLRLRRPVLEALSPIARRRSQPAGSACVLCPSPARPNRSSNGRVSPYCSDTCRHRGARRRPSSKTRGEVHITCGAHEAASLEGQLAVMDLDLRWRPRVQRTGTVLNAAHMGLAEWLAEHFGQHAHRKTMPAWALTMRREWRQALLEGYLSADGHQDDHWTTATTASKPLAVGVRLLAESLGHRVALNRFRQHTDVIEGRRVNVRPQWRVSWVTDPRYSWAEATDQHSWLRVNRVEEGRADVPVYNLEVAEDESYVVDGIVAHNCTTWSQARGKKVDFEAATMSMPFADEEGPPTSEAVVRSRATMEWVCQLAGHHRFKYMIVENVVDICKWADLPRWYAEMEAHGYRHKTCFLNAMFFGVPQSRDRFYAVFWQADCPAPDLDFRPPSWCPRCLAVVPAVQSWKNPKRQFGRYREQYLYRCPTCAEMALPFVTPALAAIDFTLPITRIGDRAKEGKKPLADATMRRIEAGIARYWGGPAVFDTMRDPKFRAAEDEPMPTQTGRQSLGLAYYIPLLVPSGGTWRTAASPADAPMPTRTGSESDGVLTPPLTARLRGTQAGQVAASARRADEDPLGAITAGGGHHALVVKNYGDASKAGPMSLPAESRPLGAVTGVDHHSLVVKAAGNAWERVPGACRIRPGEDHPMWSLSGSLEHGLVLGYGGSGAASRSTDEPMPTMAGENPIGLVYAGQHDNRTRPADEPLPTATGGNNVGLVVPLDQRGPNRHNRARTVQDPLRTQGTIQADGLVVHAGSGGAGRVRSTSDVLPTQATHTRPALALPPEAFLSAYYRTAVNRPVGEPMPTQRGHEGQALVRRGGQAPDIMDCGFRMLEPHPELLPGMGFDRGYIVLGNKRDSTQQIGQAVCPPVAAALTGRLVDAWRRGGRR